jgi:hypothetical protein
MTRLLCVAALVALGPLAGCNGSCRDVVSDRAGVSGTIAYKSGLGTAFRTDDATLDTVSPSSVALSAKLTAAGGDWRDVAVELNGLKAGETAQPKSVDDAKACLVTANGAAPTCFALVGTVEVRALKTDCWVHESGIARCADDVDLTIHLATTDPSISLHVDLDLARIEHWAEAKCEED